MDLIIFLDFDGVLHPEPVKAGREFERVPVLEDLIEIYENKGYKVWIVISSTWRLRHSLEDLKERLGVKIAQRVRGVTAHYDSLKDVPERYIGYPREAECEMWMRVHAPLGSSWVALDDRDWLFRPFNKHLIQTDRSVGLRSSDIKKVLQVVNR